jgi:hypothetical protein
MSRNPLSHGQLALLRAVAAGNVAWRHHLACGWAIRRRDIRSADRGGSMGARVNNAIQHLAKRGLVHVPEPTDFRDTPITLTSVGQTALELADIDRAAREDAVAAPHLPMAHDGRFPFPAGTDGDAPIGALLDLTDDNSEHPGWWQRHGDEWVPVGAPTDETSVSASVDTTFDETDQREGSQWN